MEDGQRANALREIITIWRCTVTPQKSEVGWEFPSALDGPEPAIDCPQIQMDTDMCSNDCRGCSLNKQVYMHMRHFSASPQQKEISYNFK